MKPYLMLLLLAVLLYSCGEKTVDDILDCPDNLACTEELRHITYSPMANGQPVVLDHYYVKNLDNGQIYQSNPAILQAEGSYLVVSDLEMDQLRQSGTILRFFGVIDNKIVLETDFKVGKDCCHIVPLGGPYDLQQ
ncbi:hypothetical protein [Roseivirga sp.]|uniref:hypothetical protein n=1 Tax=Roseivirga sp. TaxID=1964215 RepID=UPI003B52DDAA